MKIFIIALALAFALGLPVCASAQAQEKKIIDLPQPNRDGGQPLMSALSARRSDRNFKNEALSEQQTADILWAAVGVNRPEEGNRRTAPTAMNQQDVYVYLLNEAGAFQYDALAHKLELIESGDKTSLLGAPLGLVFVAPANNDSAGLNVGYCSQNVYLHAASKGLNAVAKGTADRNTLKKTLKLADDQQIVLVHLVGPRP